MGKVPQHEIKEWLKLLSDSGITKYYHYKLPKHLKNRRVHMAAIRGGKVRKTGNTKRRAGAIIHECEIMSLKDNVDGWRYKCPYCESRRIKHITKPQNTTCNHPIPDEWANIQHYRCANYHRFMYPVDMATTEFKGVKT